MASRAGRWSWWTRAASPRCWSGWLARGSVVLDATPTVTGTWFSALWPATFGRSDGRVVQLLEALRQEPSVVCTQPIGPFGLEADVPGRNGRTDQAKLPAARRQDTGSRAGYASAGTAEVGAFFDVSVLGAAPACLCGAGVRLAHLSRRHATLSKFVPGLLLCSIRWVGFS